MGDDVDVGEDVGFLRCRCCLAPPQPGGDMWDLKRWSVKEGNINPHMFSTRAWKWSRWFTWITAAPEYKTEPYSNTGFVKGSNALTSK